MPVNESRSKAIKRNTRLLNLVANPIKNKLRKELNLTTELAINSYRDTQEIDQYIFIEHRTRLERIALDGFKRSFDLGSKGLLNTFVKAKFITREQASQVQNDINITRQNFIADNAIQAAEKMAQTTENIVNKIIDSNTKKLTENSFIDDLIAFSMEDAEAQNIFRSVISAFTWSHTGIEKGSQDGAQRTEQNYPVELYKIWITNPHLSKTGVRDIHKPMDGVKVPVKEPWIVDGEKLMYPGDMSASVGNWINCVCSKNFWLPDEE